MHNVIGAVCRRTAGLATGLILGVGGLAGAVLLTPGTAYAGTTVATTTAITEALNQIRIDEFLLIKRAAARTESDPP